MANTRSARARGTAGRSQQGSDLRIVTALRVSSYRHKHAGSSQTNLHRAQQVARLRSGLNISRIWHWRIPSATVRGRAARNIAGNRVDRAGFPQLGLGTDRELPAAIYQFDTRDDLTTPSHGTQWVVYGGLASAADCSTIRYTAKRESTAGFCRSAKIRSCGAPRTPYLLHANDARSWAAQQYRRGRSDIGA